MSDATSPLLSLRNVDIAFGTRKNPLPTVFDVNFDIWPGETVAVVGESGSGKSTTAMGIMGLLPGGGQVTDGTITFDGRDITHLSEREFTGIRGSEVGLVPQDPMSNLNPVWSIGHHIKEALKANNVASGSAAHDRAVELMEEAGLTEADRRIDQFPHQFSGGQRQRALIACGLAARPKLLIADEPTSALDVTVQQQILDHLQELTEELGTAVLLITHDLGLAAERAQRIIVMSQGRIVEAGPSLEILQNPQHPYTQKLVASAPSVTARRIDLDIEEPLRDAGEDAAVDAADEASPNLIEVSGLTKIYQVPGDRPWRKKDFTAAEDVNFFLRRGHTLALVGESGSGKSTVAQMVLGLLEPTSGTVTFDGTDITHLDRAGELAFRRRVQPVFQNPYGSVDPMYSVFNTIAEPLKIHKVGSKKEQEARVRELLDLVAMPSSMLARYPGELSGGQRQRVSIARALALGPEALILDEAVSALDVLVQSQVLSLLNDLQEEMGLTYLFITHDLAVVKQIADETLVMKSGRIVERGETDDLFDNPEQEYTRRLIQSIPGGTLPLYQG
ncbi:dipeptide ABC transporter ATP-binding protein [Corynebacterium variabile]|uniref:ABC transporter ATP-binding protein n=1 Tax=Corynebacterium variabile TaxID=1727 RepID=A0A4Y4C137_9CORY|nr:ABC transporter ATP-binding protein [Corynebacterium variabile]MDN6239849.1 ABC transporter ATP-binding protein [Corynebacterium variabile]MDN6477593.1 ABC transporter ATP-binding protein [Corynebacterium variabile]MDN6845432.1 ABC transporter ATP-binding protein [Corynebacterium variabile]GEC85816.1 ABC transporter ATP-binding protein [Corynebacterium variabile]